MSERGLDEFLRTCRRLLSARGEANSAVYAATALQQYQLLSEPLQLRVFEHLDQDFGLDPAKVLEAAQQYAAAPTVQTLKNLTSVAEPPRQERADAQAIAACVAVASATGCSRG